MKRGDYSDTAVVLLNMGGPDTQEAVKPFLYNLFSDHELIQLPGGRLLQKPFAKLISTLRTSSVQANYRLIGGGSPIRQITEKQAEGLKKKLREEGYVDIRVEVAMRYWHPRAAQVAARLREENRTRVILFSLYPHYSSATTGSSLNDMKRALHVGGWDGSTEEISEWYLAPTYIDTLVEKIREGIASYPEQDQKDVVLLFSAHSLPYTFLQRKDPYVHQINLTRYAVVKRLAEDRKHFLCFQSQVGPIRWVGPKTEATLAMLANQGHKNVLVLPLSFVSDHIETLYEIDLLYGEAAKKLGLTGYRRVESLNTDPRFITALADIVRPQLGVTDRRSAPRAGVSA